MFEWTQLNPDWSEYLEHFALLAASMIIALPVAWEREHSGRRIGLRTVTLVAVGSCGYMLIAAELVGSNAEAIARVMHGLMTGIGFIGGGAILKDGASVRGTATAASIWTTGAIGVAVAFHKFDIAILLSVMNFMILRMIATWMSPGK